MQKVERMRGSVKWGNKKRKGTNRDFLIFYLAEFMWRTKLDERDLFHVILEDISNFQTF